MTDRAAPPDTLPEYDDLKLGSLDPNPVHVAGLQSAVHRMAERIAAEPRQSIDPADIHVDPRELTLVEVQRWSDAG